jgi:hypothetical protein
MTLFSVTLQKTDGQMVQKNVVAEDVYGAITKAQTVVGGTTTVVSVATLGRIDVE